MRQYALALMAFTLLAEVRADNYDLSTREKYRWTITVELPDDTEAGVRSKCLSDFRVSLETLYPRPLVRLEIIERKYVESKSAINGVKTHSFKLTHDRGLWTIQLHASDGDTGHTNSRTMTVKDSSPLGRSAAVLAVEEFGPTASIRPHSNDRRQVFAHFRGGLLPGFENVVQTGDIFAVYELTDKPALSGKPRLTTYLRAVGPLVDGEIRCEIVSSVAQPMRDAKEIVAHRAIKLTTSSLPSVRFKLANKDPNIAVLASAAEVWASEKHFFQQPGSRDRFNLKEDTFHSEQPMKGLICVSVRLQQNRVIPFVVPLIGDGPITLTLDAKAEDFVAAQFERECERLRNDVYATLNIQTDLYRALDELIKTNKQENAHTLATKTTETNTLKMLDFVKRLEMLAANPAANDSYPAGRLNEARSGIQTLKSECQELDKTVVSLKKYLDDKNDPKRLEREFRAQKLNRDIATQVERGDIPKALELYDELIALAPQDDLRKRRKDLEDEWKPKSEEHAAARKLLLERWNPARTAGDYAELTDKLAACIATLIQHKDHHGLRNMLFNLPTAIERLGELANRLDGSSEADRATIEKLKTLPATLEMIRSDAQKALKDWGK